MESGVEPQNVHGNPYQKKKVVGERKLMSIYKIKKINTIAEEGLYLFTDMFQVSTDEQAPDGIIMRSSLLDVDDLPAFLRNTPRKIDYVMSDMRWHIHPMADRPYDLDERLLDFAVSVGQLTKAFPNDRLGAHVGNQLVRSGTAPAANYAEAQAAESRRDFIHKLKISLKELRESLVWLRLARRIDLNAGRSLENALKECDELIAIFVKSIETARHKGSA